MSAYTYDQHYKGDFNILAAEKHLIMMATIKHKTRVTQAKALGICERTLIIKRKKHGISK